MLLLPEPEGTDEKDPRFGHDNRRGVHGPAVT
jgi:hypothetical protein